MSVREQDQLVPIGKPFGSIFQQLSDKRFLTLTLHMRYDKLAHRVDDLRLPLGLAFVVGIALSFVCLSATTSSPCTRSA
jgi:hypothetical protein